MSSSTPAPVGVGVAAAGAVGVGGAAGAGAGAGTPGSPTKSPEMTKKEKDQQILIAVFSVLLVIVLFAIFYLVWLWQSSSNAVQETVTVGDCKCLGDNDLSPTSASNYYSASTCSVLDYDPSTMPPSTSEGIYEITVDYGASDGKFYTPPSSSPLYVVQALTGVPCSSGSSDCCSYPVYLAYRLRGVSLSSSDSSVGKLRIQMPTSSTTNAGSFASKACYSYNASEDVAQAFYTFYQTTASNEETGVTVGKVYLSSDGKTPLTNSSGQTIQASYNADTGYSFLFPLPVYIGGWREQYQCASAGKATFSLKNSGSDALSFLVYANHDASGVRHLPGIPFVNMTPYQSGDSVVVTPSFVIPTTCSFGSTGTSSSVLNTLAAGGSSALQTYAAEDAMQEGDTLTLLIKTGTASSTGTGKTPTFEATVTWQLTDGRTVTIVFRSDGTVAVTDPAATSTIDGKAWLLYLGYYASITSETDCRPKGATSYDLYTAQSNWKQRAEYMADSATPQYSYGDYRSNMNSSDWYASTDTARVHAIRFNFPSMGVSASTEA